jgi:vitamin B12/bleomycin/antimicrobial peptide transport system ATP-binding/permease protein
MDEATSALDEESQRNLMTLIHKELPHMTVVSVGHRQQLEAFHDRKIVLEYRKGGARIVSDEKLLSPQPEGLLRRILLGGRRIRDRG